MSEAENSSQSNGAEDSKREAILRCENHLLVTGGPGAGKTTVALHKAMSHVAGGTLLAGQRILFLSFARATVARIVESSRRELNREARALIDIETYHGFAWRLIKAHSYLTNGRSPKILTPAEQAAIFADVHGSRKADEAIRLWEEEGRICFDLFPGAAAKILSSCSKLGRVYSAKYPLVIIDEFQDTNPEQYAMIRALTSQSQIVALADPDQRIYDFAGADPKRIAEYVEAYAPEVVDLTGRNHRSGGTDIAQFGNDLLSGRNHGRSYQDVKVKRYTNGKGQTSPEFALKVEIISAIKRNRSTRGGWSIAVLVPTQALMTSVSNYLNSSADGLPPISHELHVDQEGPCLAAAIIAGLLEGGTTNQINERLLTQLRSHVRGRNGSRSSPSQPDLGFANCLDDLANIKSVKKRDQVATIAACAQISERRSRMQLTGSPEGDWMSILQLLRSESEARVQKVADDARYIRLLRRGSALREALGSLWRDTGSYVGAMAAVEDALTQIHFSNSIEELSGVHVLTLHKSKGKEYTEAILFEGPFQGRYVREGTPENIARSRLLLRVGVTRARARTTILTPTNRTCPLL